MRIDCSQAIQILLSGDVVALPTETVYGLAASLKFPEAVKKIFSLKGRPADNPLIVHVGKPNQLAPYVKALPPDFDNLAEAFWPGALTLIIEANTDTVPIAVRAGLPTVAVRIPSHTKTRQVLEETGALVMPSANLSGRPSATTAQHVIDDFQDAVPVLDGGKCEQGVESTIMIYCETKWMIVREGAVTAEEIAMVLGYAPAFSEATSKPVCPGQHYKHYAPNAVLKPLSEDQSGVVVGFSDRNYPHSTAVYALGELSEPEVVAGNLYSVLRALDVDGVSEAYIDWDFPDDGLWRTIRERLRKASDN